MHFLTVASPFHPLNWAWPRVDLNISRARELNTASLPPDRASEHTTEAFTETGRTTAYFNP